MLYAKLRKRTQTLQRPKNLLMLYLYLILKGKRKGIEAKIPSFAFAPAARLP